ncbi:MAG TPA: CHC2 zinc finger domain-containing protein [Terriglobia bacterium]|nr:CHC2 zinc finger domain-containing protein [Terriglobia bacterium]
MKTHHDLAALAANYHKGLPVRIREYLNSRGIPDVLIDFHLLGWNGNRITIPVYNREGEIAFFKLARDPESPALSPKMMASPGAHAELYGWGALSSRPERVIICEGEFDSMVLEANGLIAVTSTAGAGVFRKEWAGEFADIHKVYICYDRDDAGRSGTERVASLIPWARIVELPEEVGDGGDVTDFFVRLGKTPEDFQKLLDTALPAPPAPPESLPVWKPRIPHSASPNRERIDRIKRGIPIQSIVERYVQLQAVGNTLMGLCPFHPDRNPSLAIYPQRGSFRCYGCNAYGDVITFVRDVERLSFSETLSRLEQLLPSHEPRS